MRAVLRGRPPGRDAVLPRNGLSRVCRHPGQAGRQGSAWHSHDRQADLHLERGQWRPHLRGARLQGQQAAARQGAAGENLVEVHQEPAALHQAHLEGPRRRQPQPGPLEQGVPLHDRRAARADRRPSRRRAVGGGRQRPVGAPQRPCDRREGTPRPRRVCDLRGRKRRRRRDRRNRGQQRKRPSDGR